MTRAESILKALASRSTTVVSKDSVLATATQTEREIIISLAENETARTELTNFIKQGKRYPKMAQDMALLCLGWAAAEEYAAAKITGEES